jgi:hypothetical protein
MLMKGSKDQAVFRQVQAALAQSRSASEKFLAVAHQALATLESENQCERYQQAIVSAAFSAPPPFCKDRYNTIYQQYAANSRWLAVSLMANAQREGQGSTDLWSLAACALDPMERQLVKQHAIDESRHAQMYLTLLDLNFPGLVDETFREEMNVFSPGFSEHRSLEAFPDSVYAKNPTLDDYVQINIAEIRTTFHHLMQRQALENHCPAESVKPSTSVLDALLRDELSHVAYTAAMIEKNSADLKEGELQALYAERLTDFNRITQEEINGLVFQ